MWVVFDFGSGSTYRGASGATTGWTSSNLRGVTGTAQPVNTVSANIFLTGVKLEIGSVATPFNRQSLAKIMADCQRYYAITAGHVLTTAASANCYGVSNCSFPVTMRAAPTVNLSAAGNDLNINASGVMTDNITNAGLRFFCASAAAGTLQSSRNILANAEL